MLLVDDRHIKIGPVVNGVGPEIQSIRVGDLDRFHPSMPAEVKRLDAVCLRINLIVPQGIRMERVRWNRAVAKDGVKSLRPNR